MIMKLKAEARAQEGCRANEKERENIWENYAWMKG
jgi:hypothetical protein